MGGLVMLVLFWRLWLVVVVVVLVISLVMTGGDGSGVGDGVVEHLHDGQPIYPTQNLYIYDGDAITVMERAMMMMMLVVVVVVVME